MRRALLWSSVVLFAVATVASIIGGPQDTYTHHTAVTGLAQVAFVLSFLVKAKK